MPTEFALFLTYPNPFNPVTTIKIGVPGMVETYRDMSSLQVFNINGRLISTLINDKLEPGLHTIEWDATGSPSVMYFVKLETKGSTSLYH